MQKLERKGQMIEKRYVFNSTAEAKLIERVMEDEHVGINHMLLSKGESLPEHITNSNVYMIVSKGVISLQLADQEGHNYSSGNIINIPYKTKMNASNHNNALLEFFVIKAPSPPYYQP